MKDKHTNARSGRKGDHQVDRYGCLYPILDSTLVSMVKYVPQKCGIMVVPNKNKDLVPIHQVTRWRVCMD